MSCEIHPGGPDAVCRSHDHDAPCPECGARITQPCRVKDSRYPAFCCGGCYHDQKEN